VFPKIKTFRKFALASTIATYFLIFVGGLVRVSGAGLGCPDWPKCFGRWIPPLSRDQIPAGFDAASFNFTLAWIEYLNRLAGVITGFLILIVAILAIKNFRDTKQILIPGVLAAVLVAFQGWYGSVVVKSQLAPHTVSIHMLLALVIVSLLIYTTYTAYQTGREKASHLVVPARKILLYLWLATIVQIILGTEIRSEIERILQKFPLLSTNAVLSQVGWINITHAFFGTLLAVLTAIVTMKILRLKPLSDFPKQMTGLMLVLIILQIFIGMSLQMIGIPALLQVFHLWIASIFLGVLLVLYSELNYRQV